MNIGQKLKDKRAQAGLTQETVAEKIGVSRQTLSSWENNRSYPDIVSILRLSDLYEVSLDEFLKEDTAMRKHVEESAQTLKKVWNVLCELSILLLPVAIFMQHYDWDTTAAVLYAISALLYAVPRLFVPKLFGGSWKLELLDIAEHLLIIGWLAFAPWTWEKHNFWNFHLFILLPISWLSHYVWRQNKAAANPTGMRFPWTTTVLLVASVLFMFVADSGNPDKQADPNPYAPFPNTYQVADVIHTNDPDGEIPIVKLSQNSRFYKTDPLTSQMVIYGMLYLEDPETQESEYIGELTELEVPAGEASPKGIWQTVPEDNPGVCYQVTVEADESVTISCYQEDSLQWKYLLRPEDRLKVAFSASPNLLSAVQAGSFHAKWFPEGAAYDINSLGAMETLSDFSIALAPNYPADSRTVYEEYYRDGELTTKSLTLQPDESGLFRLKSAPYHDSGTRYCIYRIPYDGGEYVFRVNFLS